MNERSRARAGAILTVMLLGVVAWLAPVAPLDPWNLLSPRKVTRMIFALAAIQVLGAAMSDYFEARTGAVMTGFFGGMISSTATTASLARRSKVSGDRSSGETLVFLSATAAMLLEGLTLVVMGTTKVHLSIIIIFIGPIFATLGMIIAQYRTPRKQTNESSVSRFQILPILKLSFLIVLILSVSQILQNLFGKNGLLILTLLVSLFEIHGSVIANIQMHESGNVPVDFLCGLLAVSIFASYLSKLFLISSLGSVALRRKTVRCTFILFCALALSWGVAMTLSPA